MIQKFWLLSLVLYGKSNIPDAYRLLVHQVWTVSQLLKIIPAGVASEYHY